MEQVEHACKLDSHCRQRFLSCSASGLRVAGGVHGVVMCEREEDAHGPADPGSFPGLPLTSPWASVSRHHAF